MNRLQEFWQRLFPSAKPLPAGIYSYQTPTDAVPQYRLHLRLEANGSAVLIVNASTVLHLNQTAAEFVYHFIRKTPLDELTHQVTRRYRISREEALKDYQELTARLETLVTTPDLDPETFLDFERQDLYTTESSAPYRLDCALTYRVGEFSTLDMAPQDRARRDMTQDEWRTILNKAWQAGIPHVIFTGGEPTLRPDLMDLITYAEKTGLVTGLLSDGLRLTNSEYLHSLLASGLDHLMLLLHPTEEQSWEALRDVLVEDLFTTVHITLTPQNADQYQAVLKRLAEMGVNSLSLSASRPDLKETLQRAREEAANLGMTLVLDLPVPYSSFHPVALEQEMGEPQPQGAGRAWLYVEPDGDVLPAQGVQKPLGNLLMDPWETIWQNARA